LDDLYGKKHILQILSQVLITLLILCAATVLSLFIRDIGFSDINIVVIYILSVLIISNVTKGYAYGIIAAVIGMLGFNFFFTEPIHTFNVTNRSYILTFLVMLSASILTSTLTSKIIKSSAIAGRREKQSQILYQISSSLAKTTSISDVAAVSAQCLSNLYNCDVSCIIAKDEDGSNREYSIKKDQRGVMMTVLSDDLLQQSVLDKYIVPLTDQDHRFGFICLPGSFRPDEPEQIKLLASITAQISIALERETLANEKETAKNETKREKYKSDLLRSISHDIRTPLSGITGAAEALLYNLKDEDSKRLIKGIYDDSLWLNQMVENILSLTKIQEGSLPVNKKLEAVEEIIGASVKYSSKFLGKHHILVEIPDSVLFVAMDARLIMQVLNNLIENAVKYSVESDEIKIEVAANKDFVWFSVTDHGMGIKTEDLTKVFDLFFVSDDSHTDAKRGNGLGLAICKAIVNAHGGKIIAENNINGGATIRFSLPFEGGNPHGKY
jgi:two-component system, OmpR family, sensor histidine kinase KdpD